MQISAGIDRDVIFYFDARVDISGVGVCYSDARYHVAFVDMGAHDAVGYRKLESVVYAHHKARIGLMAGGDRKAERIENLYRVGKIIFVLVVIIIEHRKRLDQFFGRKRVHDGVNLGDPFRFGVSVALFDYCLNSAGSAADDPAVTLRVGDRRCKHRRGEIATGMCSQKILKKFRRQKRGVAA